MLDALPLDMLALVASHLSLHDVERMVGSCRTLRETVDEAFYREVAVQWRGVAFWARALSRRTRHTFRGMRAELRIIDVFEHNLRRRALPVWTEADYWAWWHAEEVTLTSSRRPTPPARARPP